VHRLDGRHLIFLQKRYDDALPPSREGCSQLRPDDPDIRPTWAHSAKREAVSRKPYRDFKHVLKESPKQCGLPKFISGSVANRLAAIANRDITLFQLTSRSMKTRFSRLAIRLSFHFVPVLRFFSCKIAMPFRAFSALCTDNVRPKMSFRPIVPGSHYLAGSHFWDKTFLITGTPTHPQTRQPFITYYVGLSRIS